MDTRALPNPHLSDTDPLYGADVLEPFGVIPPDYDGRQYRNCETLGACPDYGVEPCDCWH